MGLLKEFKEFAMKGNVVDMAVGVVIGAAFGKIITVMVEKIIMPLVGLITGGIDFSKYDYTLRPAVMEGGEVKTPAVTIGVGSFVTEIINFVIIAFAIFMAVKMMNNLRKRFEQQAEAVPAAPPEDVVLLREIRDALRNR